MTNFDVNARDKHGMTRLMRLCSRYGNDGNIRCCLDEIKALLDAGADVKNLFDMNAWVCKGDFETQCRWIVVNKVDTKTRNK